MKTTGVPALHRISQGPSTPNLVPFCGLGLPVLCFTSFRRFHILILNSESSYIWRRLSGYFAPDIVRCRRWDDWRRDVPRLVVRIVPYLFPRPFVVLVLVLWISVLTRGITTLFVVLPASQAEVRPSRPVCIRFQFRNSVTCPTKTNGKWKVLEVSFG